MQTAALYNFYLAGF